MYIIHWKLLKDHTLLIYEYQLHKNNNNNNKSRLHGPITLPPVPHQSELGWSTKQWEHEEEELQSLIVKGTVVLFTVLNL